MTSLLLKTVLAVINYNGNVAGLTVIFLKRLDFIALVDTNATVTL